MADPPEHVRALAQQRAQARAARDFAAADAIRVQLEDQGWLVDDTAGGSALRPKPAFQVLPGPGALPDYSRPDYSPPDGSAGPGDAADRVATVTLLVQGYPDDLRECVSALVQYAPSGVLIAGLDLGNIDGSGDVLHELAAAHPGRLAHWHLPAGLGWGAARTALLRADPGPVHVIMETSTILTGDALSPLLAATAEAGVVAAGWRGADPDPDLRAFHEAGPGPVTALLGYLLAVRTGAARRAGGFAAQAAYYRNADLEFSLRVGREGTLVVPAGPLPVRQARHRGYHDADPAYRETESRRNYRRVLSLLRAPPPAS